MVPVPANALTRLSLAALACRSCWRSRPAPARRSLRAARGAEASRTTTSPSPNTTKLLREQPERSRRARSASSESKLRAAQDHFSRARRVAATGKFEEALVEYQIAAELNPGNADIERELQATRTQLRAKVAVREDGKTRLETLIAESLDAPLPGAALPDDDAARLADFPRAELARHLLRHRQVHEHERRVRPDLPRSAGLDRPARQRRSKRRSTRCRPRTRNFWRVDGAAHASSSFPTRRPSAASTRKRSSARST